MRSPATEDFTRRVSDVVAAVPPGTVVTYGEVAAEAGSPGAARAVGNVVARVDGLPWWRVVTATGRLVPGIEERHARLLLGEGVALHAGRVRLAGRSGRRRGGQDV